MRKTPYIYFFLTLIIIGLMFFLSTKIFSQKNSIIFYYPDISQVRFADEEVPFDDKHVDVKERFDKEFIVNSNTLYQFYLYVKRYNTFIPYIEKQLAEKKMPDDLKYIAIAESALRNDVVSHAGAAGIWQFMPDTAKRYGLVVNDYVDERYNFEKSTQAAISYFQDLHKIFSNWTLVAAAYNRGENGLLRDLKEQKVDSYYDLYLNEETSRYIFRILAIKYMLESYNKNPGMFQMMIGDPYVLPQTENISITKIDNLVDWSLERGQNFNTLKFLNPWILQNSLPEGNWTVKILKQ